ncbi:hypothetical protein J2752_002353 [Halarchaeum rubridurum]|uniref:Uncharacterized protein n=1 Tax=Halarchaeum rubridurum TaxID=489911 RepID=A0A8T4GP71_9EURY|nr:hypothetical protein [Halarchaeum rubridurum]
MSEDEPNDVEARPSFEGQLTSNSADRESDEKDE